VRLCLQLVVFAGVLGTAVMHPAGSPPISIAAVDLNGDGSRTSSLPNPFVPGAIVGACTLPHRSGCIKSYSEGLRCCSKSILQANSAM